MGDWQALGKVNYKRHQLYELSWQDDIGDFQNYVISAAPYGGPIAMARDERRFVLVGKGKELVPSLLIFSPSGTKLASIPWEDKHLCVNGGLSWTSDEHLVCALDNGTILIYDMFGNLLNTFPVVPPMSKITLLMVQVVDKQMVVLDSTMRLIYVPNVEALQPQRHPLADTRLGPEQVPNDMAMLPPQVSSSGDVEVMLATQDGTILVVEPGRCEDQKLQGKISAPIMKMSVAPKGTFMACFTSDGMLIVLSTKLDTKVLEFDTQTTNVPQTLLWCGEDSVILHWRQLGLVMVGPFGDWVKYPYSVPIHPSHEPDCCRIFTPVSHQIIQRVPASIEAIKTVGSTQPAAMLFDAMEAFESGDPKADENIRSIKQAGQLEDAVTKCIDAAASEFSDDQQKQLLRAAAYGKSFTEEFDSELFVETCKMIRVLNAIRMPNVGLPLTVPQFKALTPDVVINRLVMRKQHFLASKLCDYLKIKKDHVLVHWACEKIKASPNTADNEVLNQIRKKLQKSKNISYAGIAAIAEQAGRRKLATMLLDFEPRPADQVPLLLSMGEEEMALRKAIASCDMDLEYMAILYLLNTSQSKEDLYRLLFSEGHGEAVDLLVAYYKHDRSKEGIRRLNDLYLASSNFSEAAALSIQQAFQSSDLQGRLTELANAQQSYTQAKAVFHSKAVEEHRELLQEQKKLEEKAGMSIFFDKSINETIYLLCTLSKDKPHLMSFAAPLAKKFKVPDRRFYYVKINALAKTGQWDALMKFANEKKPPGGYKPFATAAFKQGERQQAELFLQKIVNNEEKYQAFVSMEIWSGAADLAIKLKDPDKLTDVRRNCNDPQLQRRIDEAAVQLGFLER